MTRHAPEPDERWSRRSLLRTAGALGAGAVAGTGTAAAGRGRNGSSGRSRGRGRSSSRSLPGRLRGIGAGTYSFVREFADRETGLVPDRVDVEGGEPVPGDRTSPANVGVQMLATVGANELGLVSDDAAVERLDTVLATLEGLETWNGLFRRWYDVETGDLHGSESAPNVSTIDNGWLSAGLVVVKQAFDRLSGRAGALVSDQDYSALYKERIFDLFEGGFTEPGLLHAKYDPNEGGLVGTFGALNAETRIAYYVAIGKGDIPEGSWWQMYRTFPPGEDFSWTNQNPGGEFVTYQTPEYGEMEVFEGHYTYLGQTYVPSWGGSMFEALMPSLVVKEKELGAGNFAVNNRRHAELQVAYADAQGYDAWGFSPAATPDGYGIFGVNQLGIWGYDRDDYATPHATFLALEYLDDDTLLENVTQFQRWGARGDYGFYDSVELGTGDPTTSYLILDQGMSMGAIANRLTGGALREHFHADPVADAAEKFLTTERFTI